MIAAAPAKPQPVPVAAARPYAQVEDVAADALAGLQPVVVVNRRTDTAIRQVDGAADRPFPTLHSDARGDVMTRLRRVTRGVNERLRGTYGDGNTVYGSVRFVPQADVSRGADAVVAALRAQGDTGVRAYGSVSFIADPSKVDSRTTYAPDDSGSTGVWVRDRSKLPTVVAERLYRSDGAGASPRPDELLRLPRQAARDAVRGWLLSDDLARSDGYIEAQVRRVAPSDVLAAVLDLRDISNVPRRTLIDPGESPAGEARATLEQHLDRLGVPTYHVQ